MSAIPGPLCLSAPLIVTILLKACSSQRHSLMLALLFFHASTMPTEKGWTHRLVPCSPGGHPVLSLPRNSLAGGHCAFAMLRGAQRGLNLCLLRQRSVQVPPGPPQRLQQGLMLRLQALPMRRSLLQLLVLHERRLQLLCTIHAPA